MLAVAARAKSMVVDLREDDLLRGVLVLVVVLSEVMKDTLKFQTFHRLEEEGLSEQEIERVREALMDLDASLDRVRGDQKLSPAVHQIRDCLNKWIDGILDTVLGAEA